MPINTKPLPKWIQSRYALLWNTFGEREFTFKQAETVLKSGSGINVFFSDLRKAGWISVTLDERDTRMRVYRLRSPQECFARMKP